jgi:hypothetical protein
VLVPFELAVLLLSARHGWWHEKLAGYRWLWQHRHDVRTRRRLVQAQRTVPDADIVHMLTAGITATNTPLTPPVWLRAVNVLLGAYWSVAEHLL